MTDPTSGADEAGPPTSLFWHAGEPVDVSDHEWSATVASFLGSGFRVRFPRLAAGMEPLEHARTQATRVADLLGTQVDLEPWLWARRRTADGVGVGVEVEVVGGWPYGLDRSFGAPWTRVVVQRRRRPDVRRTSAITLPWAYGSESPTAGLPMISSLEADAAERFVDGRHAGAGLWWNHRDELCATTAGAPVVLGAHGGWVVPDRSSGIVTSWASTAVARRLGATPVVVTRDVVLRARVVGAVSDLGGVTVVGLADDVPCAVDEGALRALLDARDAVCA